MQPHHYDAGAVVAGAVVAGTVVAGAPMTLVEGLLLGLVQGISEFLPVSSSGHSALARTLLGLEDIPILFDVLLHVATLAAITIVFRRPIGTLLRAAARAITGRVERADKGTLRLIAAIALATLCTALPGLLIGRLLAGITVRLIGLCFLATALILLLPVLRNIVATAGRGQMFAIEKSFSSEQPIRLWHAALIGLAQGVAVLPGISRSGITISVALMLSLSRRQAGEFSFLIAIPATVGALLLTLRQSEELSAVVAPPTLAAGALVAFGTGLGALLLLIGLVRRGRLFLFAPYLALIGIATIIFL